ncbi:GtrA family protein [Qipengyuania sp. 1NDW9]|uniref:GtrA family protein n=1 Tax=Qipengyuania xiapuensis TaxID=2867236 RepID=UPI001C88337F|nr:GtrA family protein [Qipengyuania xiapuensis]MBX7492750.1 GtrA family protein [Qipengyuania xiapuensis]
MDRIPSGNAPTRDLAEIARFLLVGGFNTLLGYGFILAALFFGAGDYAANAIGFALGVPISWMLHRVLTFRVRKRISRGEMGRYIAVVAVSYAVNLGIVTAGRAAGFVENPFVQLAAICVYAAVFYLLSRRFVFREGAEDAVAARRN